MVTATTLSVENLHISFGGDNPFIAVRNLSFTIERGKTLAVVGESGSGKSLTALALMGLLPTAAGAEGNVTLYSGNPGQLTTYNLLKNNTIRGLETGMVFQEPMSALNPVMTVGDQVREAIMVHQHSTKAEGKTQAIDWLGKVLLPQPAAIYSRYPHQLSGGQKQRVMIAMAMCNHPALLIADEPTTALDVTVQYEIINLMQHLQQEHNTAVLFITHDLALAAQIADQVLVMFRGELVEYGPVTTILKHPQQPYTRALLACRPSPDHKGRPLPVVTDFLNSTVTTNIRVEPTIVHPIGIAAPYYGKPLLEVTNLNVWFPTTGKKSGSTDSGYHKAVNDVSFYINRGEVLGLAGESGCGKSTLSRALIGLVPTVSGEISFMGAELTKLSPSGWKKFRTRIQMIFQDPYSSLNPRLTIGAALTEPLLVHNIVPHSELKKEALRLLDIVQLPAEAFNRYPHQFSGGQRQRIGIARALSVRPELIICDESVSALDVSIQAQILNLLKSLQAEFGLTFLFISHDLGVVQYISDRVIIMQAGKIVETGEATEVLRHPQNAYTQKMIAAMPVLTLF